MRAAVRLITRESAMLASAGKWQDAVRNQALGFGIARHTASADGNLISYLVGINIDGMTLAGLRTVLYRAKGQPDAAEAVAAVIQREWRPLSLSRALRHEAGEVVLNGEHVRSEGPKAIHELTGESDEHIPKVSPQVWRTGVEETIALVMRRLRGLIPVADGPLPNTRAAFTAAVAPPQASKNDPVKLVRAIAFIGLFPLGEILPETRAREQATADVDRLAALTLAWKDRHGSFPPDLAAVARPVPRDPFSAGPLKYRREGTGFLIYSVGPGGKFNGASPGVRPKPGNVVFRWPPGR